MNAQEIRQAYLDFFAERGHAVIPRASLVPQDDPTTLFTGSGMQPLLPYLLGEAHPKGTRLVDSQTCLRAEDIEEVGDNRHTTFFEMLGNWSLGDYFKAEQLPWFFEFLTDVVGLDPQRLYVTVFAGEESLSLPKDDESIEIWQQLFADKDITAQVADIGTSKDGATRGMRDGERIFAYNASKNWWSRVGEPSEMPEGEPGGPDSEVFYDFQTEHDSSYGAYCHPNCDCGRFLEVGNSVFMQYIKTADGFETLPHQNVDFGGGLERIAAAAIDDPDMFRISLLQPIIDGLEEVSGQSYENHAEAMRVIADHLRAAVFLAIDGVTPSNKEQGYVMRRLMRRAIKFAFDLDIQQGLMDKAVPVIADAYHDDFPEVAANRDSVLDVMQKEEKLFHQTLRKGLREFDNILMMDQVEEGESVRYQDYISGETAFKLYDTYGFPLELTEEEAAKRGIQLEDGFYENFNKALEEQRERSRTAAKGQFKGGLGGEGDMHKKYHTATHLMYRALREVLGDHVMQHGSNITDERLRFDFSHPQKMTDEEKQQVENIVNDRIQKDLQVTWKELPTDEAFASGAYGAFGDTYGDTVKVYSMVDEDGNTYSYEICGGPHVERTGELAEDGPSTDSGSKGKKFKIKKEESSSAGIRRIKAILE